MIKDLHSFVRIEVPRAEIFPHFFAYNLLKVFEKLWYVPKFLSPTFKNNFSKPGTGNYIIYFDDLNLLCFAGLIYCVLIDNCLLSSVLPFSVVIAWMW
jgi:hypothetical protein